jgi:peptide/nickel transport system substrate-binding protein
MKRLSLALVAAVGLLGVAMGLTSTTEAQAADQLRVGFVDPPQGFDPALAVVGASHQVIDLVFSGLTKLDANADPQPDLAESWTVSDDGKIYTFKLRQGVKWHDGEPLTADDVVFTFKRLMDPKTGYPYSTQVESFADVKAIDPTTVELTLSRPTGPLLSFLAFPGNFIVPKHIVSAGPSLTSTPIGTGPYKFVSYRPNQELILAKNPDYYVPGLPKMDLDIKYINNDTERTNALLGGNLDFASRIAPRDYDQIVGTPGFVGSETIGGRWYSILTNVDADVTKNKLVRQAIAYAIDRKAMADVLFFGHAQPMLGGAIPDWSWAHDASTDVIPEHGDIAKAKALLAEAGYPDGVKIDMTLCASWKNLVEQGPLLKEMLAKAGIEVNLISMENPRWVDEVWVGGKYQTANNFWLSPLADPDDFIYLSYKCKSGMNAQRYCNKEFDALIEEARYTADKAKRKELYTQATRIILDEMPLVPTVNAGILDAMTDKVKGWVPMRTGMYRGLEEVTLSQ